MHRGISLAMLAMALVSRPASCDGQAGIPPNTNEVSLLQQSLELQQSTVDRQVSASSSDQDSEGSNVPFASSLITSQKPRVPEEITDNNRAHTTCFEEGLSQWPTLTFESEYGDPMTMMQSEPRMDNVKLFYWFDRRGQERCMAAYIPPDAPKPMPVMLTLEAYDAGVMITGNMLFAYEKYNMASFLLSTPMRTIPNWGISTFLRDRGLGEHIHEVEQLGPAGLSKGGGQWIFPGGVSDENPQPCDHDNEDLEYFNTILDFIGHVSEFDESKVYMNGYSQNSMFAGYAGFCNSHRIAGIVQSGSGIVERGVSNPGEPYGQPYGCDWDGFYNKIDPRDNGTYWPIYPCHTEDSEFVYCSIAFSEDFCANSNKLMFEYAVQEGYTARAAFVHGGCGLINPPKKHGWVDNFDSWMVGCLGVFERCSEECASDLRSCIEENKSLDELTAMCDDHPKCDSIGLQEHGDRWSRIAAWNKCMGGREGQRVSSCAPSCSPTRAMLELSQDADFLWNEEYPQWDSPAHSLERPITSKCDHQDWGW